ncbi:MAG: hypothetical protein EOP11_19020 [Proteobacteria bacterium]|nr:MAG: hypothetical protein EOP11_19020 [Pseudomonadota bacterium]
MRVAIQKPQSNQTLREEFNALADSVGHCLLELKVEQAPVYLGWVQEHHYLVKRTMRYISLAAGLAPAEDSASFAFWMKALKEETNHHRLLENDARFLGAKPEDFRASERTQRLASQIFEEMLASGGASLFGYALLLEGLSCKAGTPFMKRVAKAHGPKAASFLSLHTIVDDGHDGHFEHGLEFVEKTYDEATKQHILASLRASAEAYNAILNSLK